MDGECLSARMHRIGEIAWDTASAYDRVAESALSEFYDRLLPYWPTDEIKVAPEGATRLLELQLTAAERMLLEDANVTAIERGWRERAPTRIDRRLVKLTLCCAILVDAGRLSLEEDPSVPVLELFERGFSLTQDHATIELNYDGRIKGVAMPTRAQVEARVAARR